MYGSTRIATLVAFALLATASAPPPETETLVIPAANESVDGNTALAFPFGVTLTSNFPYRFQQVYESAEFGALPDVIRIRALRFRIDQATGGRDPFVVDSMQVRLGTTSREADGLATPDFDSNLDGGDTTLVFDGALAWDPCGTEDTCVLPPFDLEIPFTTPFVYDAAAGNLLVDFLNLSDRYDVQLIDFANAADDGISHVRSVLDRNNPDPENPIFVDPAAQGTWGLVTQFVYTVPEAGAALAGAAALAALGALRRGRA